ncbi:phage tail protein [Pseudomonas sp. WJP1]|uniref:phage tail protein n=1 Tax=Pseudomonas sp. WJP1 TaxID=2986947 RepID=UPI00300DDD80
MPWYKSGTVSVTQNSNAVLGAGTAFIANSRVGDAFRGPDGAWYEVTNIASDTALSISPNYQGATNAAGIYTLAPMQGYVKDSADALRALVNQYGTKLAALGTTGNYDILPVTKGGTGGTSQADARTGLGLGSVATENTLPINKGGTGRTDGRALFSEVSAQLAAALFSTQGMYMGWNSSSQGEGHFIVNRGGGNGGFTWRSVNADNSATGPTMSYSYAGLLTVPTLTVTGAPIPQSSGGTGATSMGAGAVGTVSQTSGVPTGKVVEAGSNANGTFTKFADGTLICRYKYAVIRTMSSPTGSLFFGGSGEGAKNFPATFIAAPVISIQGSLETGEGWFVPGSTLLNSTTQWPSGYVFTQISRGAMILSIDYLAVGRWF